MYHKNIFHFSILLSLHKKRNDCGLNLKIEVSPNIYYSYWKLLDEALLTLHIFRR